MLQFDGTSDACFDGLKDLFMGFGPIILGFGCTATNHIDVKRLFYISTIFGFCYFKSCDYNRQ